MIFLKKTSVLFLNTCKNKHCLMAFAFNTPPQLPLKLKKFDKRKEYKKKYEVKYSQINFIFFKILKKI